MSHDGPFLATTALEDFWDTSRPMVFLGDWCRRYSRKHAWQTLAHDTMPSAWADRARWSEAYEYVARLYERILPPLASALNDVHRETHGIRYWRIVAGPWLLHYLPLLYDRFLALQAALAAYPALTTTVLAPESWVTPADTFELSQYAKDDPYNLQVYSRLLHAMGHTFPAKAMRLAPPPFFQSTSLWKGAVVKGMAALAKVLNGDNTAVLRHSYFEPQMELRLLARTAGAAWPFPGGLEETSGTPLDLQTRDRLNLETFAENDFERMLAMLLPRDLPRSLVEAYSAINQQGERHYPRRAKTAFSAIAWLFDEPFKQWAARRAEAGTLLLGMQHGGGYGADRYFWLETHELAITDRYFSWGWESSAGRAKVTPAGATKLAGRPRVGADGRKKDILFVMTSWRRYLVEPQCPPNQYARYLERQPRFVANVRPELRAKLRVRFHREDQGWDVAERWRDFFPEAVVENWNVSLWDSLRTCRIFMADHASTTYLEALAADVPTIVFWDPLMNEPRDEARPYYDLLRTAGILHDDPESGAATLNRVYDDVVTWWNDPARQQARRSFCDHFARVPEDPVRYWSAVFRRGSAELRGE